MNTFMRRSSITSLTWFQVVRLIGAAAWYSGYMSHVMRPLNTGVYWMQSSAAGQSESGRR